MIEFDRGFYDGVRKRHNTDSHDPMDIRIGNDAHADREWLLGVVEFLLSENVMLKKIVMRMGAP
jgi:hypothetical protein